MNACRQWETPVEYGFIGDKSLCIGWYYRKTCCFYCFSINFSRFIWSY